MLVTILYCCAWASSPALAQHNYFDSIDQDNGIKEKTMVFYIVQIILKLFDSVFHGGSVPIADLRPPRYSGLDTVPDVVERYFRAELVYKIGPFRTGTDKAHIAIQDIEYLGKLIYSQLPNNSPDAGYPGIIRRGPLRLPAFLGIVLHTPEFENHKRFSTLSHPFLP